MFQLRPATESDRQFCWQLLRETMKPHVRATWGWDDKDQLARFDAGFEPSSRQVVEFDGRPVGILQVDFSSTPVRLHNMQIAPPFQGRGIGTGLIRTVLAQAGMRPVWLQVLKVNPARGLYERTGFRIAGETTTHWQMIYEPSPSSRSSKAR